ncbi:hypothetical protein BKA62DRAFT_695348 [Auriculariales sp. MPI-PUGE-AT-0066]|nr:hypothetical protein BKA62DRAFT_695348 [Auriculariales sp. MPI-PUGE-AT-0066]
MISVLASARQTAKTQVNRSTTRTQQAFDSDSDSRGNDAMGEDPDSDWEEGRTLVPPEDQHILKAVEQNAYLNGMIESLAESFTAKNAEAKPNMLAALEPALDIIAGVHSFLKINADAPFLEGVELFDQGSGRMHGAVVQSHDALGSSIPALRSEMQTLFGQLGAQYKARDALVAAFQQRAAACAKQLEQVLEDGDAALNAVEREAEHKEKLLLKQGTGPSGKISKKAEASKILKQLLG